jgi:hypothetical protein
MRLVALLLALAACGDNLPDSGDPRSGARLKLGWWVYEDGTRQRETSWYYDAVLGVRCMPATFSDGVRYCGPDSDEAVYTSDTCTQALGRVPVGSTPRLYATTRFYLNGEPEPSRVFRAGAPTFVPGGVWEKHHNGCWPAGQSGDFDYYELGNEVTGDLVRLRGGQRSSSDELAIVEERSDDGLRVATGLLDRARASTCISEDIPGAASVACVPTSSVLASYFHDVECLEPELASVSDPLPTVARQYSARSRCWSYYDVGAQVTAPPLYEPIGGSCVPSSPPGGATFYVMGPPAMLPLLRREPEASTRRLRQVSFVSEGIQLPDDVLFDAQLGTECRRDASARCVPATDAQVMPFFADPGCQQPLQVALVPSGDCAAPAKYARQGDEYVPLLVPLTVPFYELSTGDTCGVFNVTDAFVPYLVKAALDPAAFATARLEIDP